MKKLRHLTGIFGLFLLIFAGCSESASDESININGRVVENNSGDPLAEAIVEITSPQDLSGSTISAQDGSFSFNNLDINGATEIIIQARKTGFQQNSINVAASPGIDVNLESPIQLQREGSGGDDDGKVGGRPAGAAFIVLTGIENETINIAESGGIVNTSFTFEVQDSAGRALDLDSAVDVEFRLKSGPGGGESITPTTARTNNNGSVTANLSAGNVSGVVQIEAIVERPEVGLTIVSKPVAVTIHGGFPDPEYFSIGIDRYNFEGYSINGITNVVTVQLGDQFSNPVKPGTAVYFNTTGGIIQGSGQGHTDENGFVNVTLFSADPRPNDNIPGSDGRPGYGTISAYTVDKDGNEISESVPVLFSTSSALISATPTTFDLAPNGGASFTYTVTDLNGNPMPAGTTIVIEGGEGIEITGNNNVRIPNALFPGSGVTDFSFSIRDTDEESSDAADLTLQIKVTTPSGNETVYSGINGTRRKAAN